MTNSVIVEFKKQTGIDAIQNDNLKNYFSLTNIYEIVFQQKYEQNITKKEGIDLKFSADFADKFKGTYNKYGKERSHKREHEFYIRWIHENLLDVKFDDGMPFYELDNEYIVKEIKTKGRPRTEYYVDETTARVILAKSNTRLGKMLIQKLVMLDKAEISLFREISKYVIPNPKKKSKIKLFKDWHNSVMRLHPDWNQYGRTPAVVGKYTNNYIYNQFAKEVTDCLTRLYKDNNKKYQKIQFTTDRGQQDLEQFIENVTKLANECSNWQSFIHHFQVIYGVQQSLLDIKFFENQLVAS